jgi:SAM-dependent methyltransferase
MDYTGTEPTGQPRHPAGSQPSEPPYGRPGESKHQHRHDHHGDDPAVDPGQWFSQEFWDERYSGPPVWSGEPNPLLVRYAAGLAPGLALDVGSGEGADVLWLASHGWKAVGADVSPVALRRSAGLVERAGREIAARISWQQADVLSWQPPERHFDLVSVQFMHLPGRERESLHRRLAAAVRPGGTFLVVGHHPADMGTMNRPYLPGMFATGEEMATVLDPVEWAIETGDPERQATDSDGTVVTIRDAVLRAVRRG